MTNITVERIKINNTKRHDRVQCTQTRTDNEISNNRCTPTVLPCEDVVCVWTLCTQSCKLQRI